jgi:hypothetical protein
VIEAKNSGGGPEDSGPSGVAQQRMACEDQVRRMVDAQGVGWTKVYWGSGAHFDNWLAQCRELRGVENLWIEEVDPRGLACFESSGEKLYRIWAKDLPLQRRAAGAHDPAE